MSAAAVLNTAYTLAARRASEADRFASVMGHPSDLRDTLDRFLGVSEDATVDDEATTNVVELAAWVHAVNSGMGDA